MGRLWNMAQWAQLMIESVVYIFVPSDIFLPHSSRYLMDGRVLDKLKLTRLEREEVSKHVICTGFACIFTGFGALFGFFGKYTPAEVFNATGNNPINVIINRRKNERCCICLSRFKLGCDVHVLPCKHCFHKQCYEPWEQQKSCPLCRGPSW